MSAEQLPLRHAVALGLIQGPAELLPISSSSHTALIPWLMRWRSEALDVELRRSLEVALHGGTAAALLAGGLGSRMAERPPARSLLLATAPPAAAGFVLERFIDRKLSSPKTIALGLLAGAAFMAAADGATERGRRARDAGALDGLLLGGAQMLALAPGVSRNGATLAIARARGFGRADAQILSWQVGVPVIAGAAALKTYRETRRGRSRRFRGRLAAGASAAFLSTLVSTRVMPAGRVGAKDGEWSRSTRAGARGAGGALMPYALYRLALALVVIRRLRDDRDANERRLRLRRRGG